MMLMATAKPAETAATLRLEDLHGEIEYRCLDRWVRATMGMGARIRFSRPCDNTYPHVYRDAWRNLPGLNVQASVSITQRALDAGEVRLAAIGNAEVLRRAVDILISFPQDAGYLPAENGNTVVTAICLAAADVIHRDYTHAVAEALLVTLAESLDLGARAAVPLLVTWSWVTPVEDLAAGLLNAA